MPCRWTAPDRSMWQCFRSLHHARLLLVLSFDSVPSKVPQVRRWLYCTVWYRPFSCRSSDHVKYPNGFRKRLARRMMRSAMLLEIIRVCIRLAPIVRVTMYSKLTVDCEGFFKPLSRTGTGLCRTHCQSLFGRSYVLPTLSRFLGPDGHNRAVP
jgi:hypothetical protein